MPMLHLLWRGLVVVGGRAVGEPSSLLVCCLDLLDGGSLYGHLGGREVLGAPPLVT